MTHTLQDVRPASRAAESARLVAVGLIWVATAVTAIGTPTWCPARSTSTCRSRRSPSGSGPQSPAPMPRCADRRRPRLAARSRTGRATMTAAAPLAPVMETGQRPDQIPIAALVAPPVAAVVTGFLALGQATRR